MFVINFLVILVLWFLLSGYLSLLPLLPGILSIFIIIFFNEKARRSTGLGSPPTLNILSLLKSLPYFLWEIMKSNVCVIKCIISGKTSPSFVEINNEFKIRAYSVLYGNLVTLTPGSLTVNLSNENKFLIHAINDEVREAILNKEMVNSISDIEQS